MFSVREKERPSLKQRSPYVQGVQRLLKHSKRFSRICEHNVWTFSVWGKREAYFEIWFHLMFEVFGDCLNKAKGVQGTVNTKYGHSVFGEKERPTLKEILTYV